MVTSHSASEKGRPLVYISADPSDAPSALYTLNRVVLQLGGIPVHSYFSEDAGEYDWPLIRKTIDECDYFIFLVGDTYGQLSPSGESYIHREAVYAKGKQKGIFAFLKNAELKSLNAQELQRLKSLHRLMMAGTFKYWNQSEDLLLLARQVLRGHLKPSLSSRVEQSKAPHRTDKKTQEAITDTLFDMDGYPMRFSGKVFAHGNCHSIDCNVVLTWDKTFLNLGSMMTAPVTEERMRGVVDDYVAEQYRDQFMDTVVDAHALADVRSNELEFQRLKAFLKGAGVIENVAAEQSGIRNYWQLTQQGEKKLHKLLLPE